MGCRELAKSLSLTSLKQRTSWAISPKKKCNRAHTSTTKILILLKSSPCCDCSPADVLELSGASFKWSRPHHATKYERFLLTTSQAEEAGQLQYYCAKGGTDAGSSTLEERWVLSTNYWSVHVTSTPTKPLYTMDDFLQAQAFLQALLRNWIALTVDLIKHYYNIDHEAP